MVRMQITVQSLLCHDNVDVVLVKNPTKLLKECFVGGNVAHLIVRILGGGDYWGVGIIIVSLMIFLLLAVHYLVAVYPEQPSLLQSLERSKLYSNYYLNYTFKWHPHYLQTVKSLFTFDTSPVSSCYGGVG